MDVASASSASKLKIVCRLVSSVTTVALNILGSGDMLTSIYEPPRLQTASVENSVLSNFDHKTGICVAT